MVILQDRTVIARHPTAIASVLRQWIASLDPIDRAKEHFFVVLLDARNNSKLIDVVSVGTIEASLVHPREVFVRAIREHAAQIIIAHNHPSGVCEPSDADIHTTRRLKAAGELLGIKLADHIIVSLDDYYSFYEKEIL